MVSNQFITKGSMYKQLTMNDRIVIARLLKQSYTYSKIAKIIGVHPSTISREIKRNSIRKRYKASYAKNKLKQRRYSAKYTNRIIENDIVLQKRIKYFLSQYYSPEQISGRLKYENIFISHTTIYAYIVRTYPKGKMYLRHPQRRRIYGTKRVKQRLQEVKKVRIDKRPKCIENRTRLGDFEGDTVILGGRKQRLYTLVDRKSGYLLMTKLVPNIYGVSDLIYKDTKKLFKKYDIKSITYDNGSEFSLHKLITRDTNIPIYFAYPYHSWERGSNENTNGLIRQFFPKRMMGDTISEYAIRKVQDNLNHRPRKRLGYLTPHEVYVLKKCVQLKV